MVFLRMGMLPLITMRLVHYLTKRMTSLALQGGEEVRK
ncbi:hypothetical protein Vsou_16420 [Vulcanisaeta souniana JCM 11219]|uniref:Uncharacterized protein n=1 Tax=Vulcanisaeta souniana JCM 11219 TaxID=1293586 RepID=A0ABN6SSF6_9CREN|nr:hypothetical protein Vsou_16420 [Vulcanisaeta souniana JCM 11219]